MILMMMLYNIWLVNCRVRTLEDFCNSTYDNLKLDIATIKREDVKVGRNEIISITNGTETKEMKYKKAKPLIDSGEWRIS